MSARSQSAVQKIEMIRRSRIKRGKPPKKVKTGTLKNKLENAFSAMIRTRDYGLMCISCRTRPAMEPGHFISRRHLATKWHPRNVHGQCNYCNRWLHGNVLEYGDQLDAKYGLGTAMSLRELARMSWKPSHEALEKLLESAKLGSEAYQETWEFYGAKRL